MATEKNGTKATTSINLPNATDYLNLSDYMYEAYDTAYSSTPLSNAIGYAPLLKRDGSPVEEVDDADGLYAEAFVSTAPGPKQVIIAYEGTNLFEQGNVFTAGQVTDDSQIYAGKKADSYVGSASFAQDVISIAARRGIAKNDMYVTGHSLGATEAQYAASQTGLAGATFAGPGINTKFTGNRPGKVVDYVDAGDPIGNYAADGNNVLAPALASTDIKHYGQVVTLPNSVGEAVLVGAAIAYESGDASVKEAAVAGALAANLDDHYVAQYASDLGVPLYLQDNPTSSDATFYSGVLPAGGSTSRGSVDSSWITAGMTGGGVSQGSNAGQSAGNESVLAASDDTQPAHALGVHAHHAG